MTLPSRFAAVALVTFCLLGVPKPVRAHCDTLNGPVVSAARVTLQSNDVTPVLRWVPTAKRLIEVHHGTITVDCPPSGGTTVSIQLPTQSA